MVILVGNVELACPPKFQRRRGEGEIWDPFICYIFLLLYSFTSTLILLSKSGNLAGQPGHKSKVY